MNKSKIFGPALVIGIGILLIVIAIIWQLRGQGQVSRPIITIAPGDVSRVTLLEAKKAYDDKAAVFIDVRDAGSYATSHIPGALNIPVNEIDKHYKELDPNQWIITYCT
jgi:3-mercaptopyruvate sulfurtransferase SseA